MIPNEFKPKPALQVARIMYFALTGGLLLFLCVALYITTEKFYFKAELSDPFLIILLIMSLTLLPIGDYISIRALPSPDTNEKLPAKFPMCQTRLIMRMATCEEI